MNITNILINSFFTILGVLVGGLFANYLLDRWEFNYKKKRLGELERHWDSLTNDRKGVTK